MDTKMLSLAIVPLVVWIGLFFYLLMVERRLARIESDQHSQENDDL